jgi:hypothetical protein
MLYHGGNTLPHGYGADAPALSTADTVGLVQSGISGLSNVLTSAISGYTTSSAAQLATQQQLAALRLQYQQERALAKIQQAPASSGAPAFSFLPAQTVAPSGDGMSTTTLLVLAALGIAAVVILAKK